MCQSDVKFITLTMLTSGLSCSKRLKFLLTLEGDQILGSSNIVKKLSVNPSQPLLFSYCVSRLLQLQTHRFKHSVESTDAQPAKGDGIAILVLGRVVVSRLSSNAMQFVRCICKIFMMIFAADRRKLQIPSQIL